MSPLESMFAIFEIEIERERKSYTIHTHLVYMGNHLRVGFCLDMMRN